MERTRPARWRGHSLCVLALLMMSACDDGGAGANPMGGAGGTPIGAGGEGGSPNGPIECRDGVQSGIETDVDCGGPDCVGCSLGGACTTSDDCLFGTCAEGVCACTEGFAEIDGLCVDPDACADSPCGENAICTDTVGSFECECDLGFERTEDGCIDLDECGVDVCGGDFVCRNTPGSFECVCPDGLEAGEGGCIDIDECAAHDCGPHAECLNTIGGFECICDAGWVAGEDGCVDDDECAVVECGQNQVCENTPGDFACRCLDGFRQRGGGCADVDECADGVDDCGENAECRNTDGGFECACLSGFVQGVDGCVDLDECALDTHDCGLSSVCRNTPGGFECGCEDGFELTPDGCIDIDECALPRECFEMGLNCEPRSTCAPEAACENTVGGHECLCGVGFEGDGVAIEAGGTGCTPLRSCAELRQHDPALPSGNYTINPGANIGPVGVYCDMEADDGVGYTMARLQRPNLHGGNGVQGTYRAACEQIGLELIVPRSRAHLAAITAYNNGELPNLVGVYPTAVGVSGLSQYTGRCGGEACTFYLSDSDSSGCPAVFEPSGDNSLDSALFRARGGCGFGFNDTVAQRVDFDGYVLCSTNDVGPRPRSCQHAMAHNSLINTPQGGVDGDYMIHPSGAGGEAPYSVWCLQSEQGGGWALAMQSRPGDFAYDDPAWTNDELIALEVLPFDIPGLQPGRGKYRPFIDQPVGEVLLAFGLQPFGGGIADALLALPVLGAPPSLRALFDEGGAIEAVGRQTWIEALWFGQQLQPNCNAEGVNVTNDQDQPIARIGLVGNNEDDCLTPDSVLGLGFNPGPVCPADVTYQGLCQRGGGGFTADAALFVREPL